MNAEAGQLPADPPGEFPLNPIQSRPQTVSEWVDAVLGGQLQPHQMPAPLHDLWRDGFRVGWDKAAVHVEGANREADHWYYVANNPAEARAEHQRTLAAFSVRQHRASTAERWAELDRIAAERAQEAAS